VDLHAIEQTQLRRQHRVDGVGRLKFDFHTGVNAVIRTYKSHAWVRACAFDGVAGTVVDLSTTGATLFVYCSPTLTSGLVDACGACVNEHYNACGPVDDAWASRVTVTWPE
jgi:hypothetical protein